MKNKVYIHPEFGSFHLQLILRIDWSELDLFAHVNNVMFFKYIQSARVNYWEAIGLDSLFPQNHPGPMLASTSCQFKQPLFYPGKITIWTKVKFIKNTSFGLLHLVINHKEQICAIAEDVVVMYDYQKNEKVRVHDWLRNKINEIETL